MSENLYADMVDALREKFPPATDKMRIGSAHILLEEVRVGTGWKGDNEQRIDVWIMQETGGNMKVAIEIKTNRADFLSEIRKPLKRRPSLRLSNKFYFYAPKGVIKPEEVPPECGLFEYDEVEGTKHRWAAASIVETVKAPWRDVFPPTWSFIASVYRNLKRQQQKEGSDGK